MDSVGGIHRNCIFLCRGCRVVQHLVEDGGRLSYAGAATEILFRTTGHADLFGRDDHLPVVGEDFEVVGERNFVVAIQCGDDRISGVGLLVEVVVETSQLQVIDAEQLVMWQ